MNRSATTVVLVVAAAALAPPALAAQRSADPTIPVPETSRRVQAEPPTVGPGGGRIQLYEVWRVGAPPEMLLGWYGRALNKLSAIKDGPIDTSDVRMGDLRPTMSYHVTYHTFENRCADSGDTTAAAGDTTRPCKHWLFGKDKHKLLENNRVFIDMGEYVERVTFTWLTREMTGELLRRQVELRDTGVSGDLKRYTLTTQITLIREQLEPPTSTPTPSP